MCDKTQSPASSYLSERHKSEEHGSNNNFLYSGEAKIAEEDLNDLLETAEDLEINGLVQKETTKSTEPNIKEDCHDIVEDIEDSKEVFLRNTKFV